MRPRVSVVVVAYRLREELLACLDSIAAAVEELEREQDTAPRPS